MIDWYINYILSIILWLFDKWPNELINRILRTLQYYESSNGKIINNFKTFAKLLCTTKNINKVNYFRTDVGIIE